MNYKDYCKGCKGTNISVISGNYNCRKYSFFQINKEKYEETVRDCRERSMDVRK